MFWNNIPDWIKNLDDELWLYQNFVTFLDVFPENQFYRKAPVILNKDFKNLKNDNSFLEELSCYLAEEARIEIKKINIDIYSEDNIADILEKMGIPYFSNQSATNGKFFNVTESGVASIAINQSLLSNYPKLLGTLSHELSHVYMHQEYSIVKDNFNSEDEEHLTDLLAIILGFGMYICNSCEMFTQFSDGINSGWESSVSGYLTLEECSFVQGMISHFCNQEFKEFKKYLSPNPKKFIAESITYLEKNIEELNERIGQV